MSVCLVGWSVLFRDGQQLVQLLGESERAQVGMQATGGRVGQPDTPRIYPFQACFWLLEDRTVASRFGCYNILCTYVCMQSIMYVCIYICNQFYLCSRIQRAGPKPQEPQLSSSGKTGESECLVPTLAGLLSVSFCQDEGTITGRTQRKTQGDGVAIEGLLHVWSW